MYFSFLDVLLLFGRKNFSTFTFYFFEIKKKNKVKESAALRNHKKINKTNQQ